jgi:Ca2+-transporting ATPase
MTYIVAIHVPIAGLALLPVLFGLPPLLLPAHVVLTEMVVDPVCSFAFEAVPEQPGLMQRPPRPARQALLGRGALRQGLAEGALLLLVVLGIYVAGLRLGSTAEARTLAVVALTAGNLMLVAVNTGPHGRRGNGAGRVLLLVATGAAAALAVGIAWPQARELLAFAVPSLSALAAAVAAACGAVLAAAAWTQRLGAAER